MANYLADDEKVEEEKAPAEEYRSLLAEVKAREKAFEDGWWKAAEEAVKLYNNEKENGKDTSTPYNILYSNTEVLKPSLYSATPKPDVRGRFIENPVSPLTKLVEHFLIVFSDPSNPGEESLDSAMDESVTSALVSGMGFIRLRSYPERPVPLCPEAGHYKGLIWPAGRKWTKLPWIAFRHEMRKDEILSQFKIPEEKQVLLKTNPDLESAKSEGEKNIPEDSFLVYEVWLKDEKEVYYLCEDWEPLLLAEEEDTLKLQGFFPTPGPLLMTHKPGSLIPTPLYQYYRSQAEELNRVTVRLNKVLSAIKVRGAYSALLGTDMAKILSDDDSENHLVAAAESALLSQTGGFDRMIWLLPIEKLITVAKELYAGREAIKQVIYELTGLSDIIRGSSIASETATAQNLKNKWGSIRLRDMQKAVAQYVRDLYRLTTDAGAKNVPAKQWQAITQAPIPTEEQQKLAREQVQHLLAQAQAQAAIAQSMGMQPEPPKPPPPELMQAAQGPTIESLLKQIQSDANRTFTINVQSDSTIDLDTATDKIEVTEFMNAMGQLMAGLQPLAALGPSGLNAGKEILVAVCSRFKFGLSILDSLKALEAPPPAQNGPTPEQEAKEKELTQKEKELQDVLEKIEDEKRNLDVMRKEWAADIKVQQAEMQAEQKVMQANQQVVQAGNQAKSAQEEAAFVKRKSELTSATAGLKANVKASQKAQEAANPAMEQMAAAVSSLTQAVAQLQQGFAQMSKRPKAVKKVGDSYVPEYD